MDVDNCPHYKNGSCCLVAINCNTWAIYDTTCLLWALNRIKELEGLL